MRSQRMFLLVVFLLCTSLTACLNNNSSLNLNSNNNASSNTITETRVPASPSSTPITIPSDSKTENMQTQMPSEVNKNSSVLEAYKAVLQNKGNFISTENKKKVDLNGFLTNEEIFETTFKVTRFTVLDLDGDKSPEVVLEITPGENPNPEFFEVLHYMNGSVYGYIQVYRGFNNLKTDGTFGFAGSASYNGFGKLRFESDACETDKLGYQDNRDGAPIFIINNKPVTEEAYNSMRKEENRKKDAVWYEFSQMNIEKELSIGLGPTPSGDGEGTLSLSTEEVRLKIIPLLPEGWHVMEDKHDSIPAAAIGDLNKDGIPDVAAVIEGPSDTSSGFGPRSLLLAFGRQDKTLELSLISDKVVLSADAGGVWGDPFDGIVIERGTVLIRDYGGSNWRWYNRCRFRYQDNDWYLIGYTTGSYYTGTTLYENADEDDYNLLTGDYILRRMSEDGKIVSQKGNRGKKELIKLREFDMTKM